MGFFDSFKTGFGSILGQIGGGILGGIGQGLVGLAFGGGGSSQLPGFQIPGSGASIFPAQTPFLTPQQQQLIAQQQLNQQLLLGQAATSPSFANPFFQFGGGALGSPSFGRPAGTPFTFGGGPNFGQGLGPGFNIAGGAQQVAFPTTLATGFPLATQAGFGGLLQQFGQSTGLGIPGLDIVPQGIGSLGLQGSGLMSPFRRTLAGASAQTFIASNPVTGRSTWFRPAGRPILWSGDLTSCKRVNKIARRAKRAKR